MKIHSPYCPLCDRSFRDEYERKAHVENKHVVDVREQCKMCDLRFKNVTLLRNHVEGVHRQRNSHVPRTQGRIPHTSRNRYWNENNVDRNHASARHRAVDRSVIDTRSSNSPPDFVTKTQDRYSARAGNFRGGRRF